MNKYSEKKLLLLFAIGFVLSGCGLFDGDKTYTLSITISPEEGGTIIPESSEYPEGETVTLQGNPSEGWKFARWEGDWSSSENPSQITMNRDYSIIGVFEKRKYPLNITIEGEGSVREEIVQQKTADYKYGTLVRLKAEPYENWKFLEWDGNIDGQHSEGNPIELLIDQPKNITALFVLRTRDSDTEVVEITSPVTGRVWMDRNLGASRAASSPTDSEAYGDLYQWGRLADGHQKRSSPVTSILSDSDQPGRENFILAPDEPYDWRSPQNDDLWQGVDGVNNPCPAGYRLPTEAEWKAERNSWDSNDTAGAFASPLKLPMVGYRNLSRGSLFVVDSRGGYWSSTVSGTRVRYLFFDSSNAGMASENRANGRSVRCIKD